MQCRERKTQILVEAYRLPPRGDFNLDGFHAWCDQVGFHNWESGRDETLLILYPNSTVEVPPGGWVIKAPDGYMYGFPHETFEKLYAMGPE